MNIFVTGATGFVGSHLTEALLAKGHSVRILVRSENKLATVFGEGFADRPDVTIVRGSLTDINSLEEGCRNADAVFHLAALTAARNRQELHAINAGATKTLTAVAREHAPSLSRFVYVSTAAAAGPSKTDLPVTEADPPRPASQYGWSKLAGEEAVTNSGLPFNVIRPPVVYGPRDVEGLTLFKIAKTGINFVFGDGSQQLSFIYGPDLAEWMARLLETPTENKTFFASHDAIHNQIEYAALIYRAVDPRRSKRSPFTIKVPGLLARGVLGVTGGLAKVVGKATLLNSDKANEFLAEAWTCDSSALRTQTGWAPPTSMEDGLRLAADWYREAGWL